MMLNSLGVDYTVQRSDRDKTASNRRRRLKMVAETIQKLSCDKPVTSHLLYKRLRRDGYPMKYKTMQRDLIVLQGRHLIRLKVLQNNPRGRTTQIEPAGVLANGEHARFYGL